MVIGVVVAGPIAASLVGGAVATGGLTAALGIGTIAGLTTAGQSLVAQQALQPQGEGFPRIRPGDLLRAALDIQALSERGLTPVASTDPFTGDLVVSTQDQSGVLFDILGSKFASRELAATPEEIEETRSFRDLVVRELARPTARVLAPGVVGRRDSDLAVSRRLGGPCAAANTGFTRLRCGRGGFS